MKLTKMSLVAALLVGSSAFAIDNIKVSGDAKLFYSTSDAYGNYVDTVGKDKRPSLFDKDASAADIALSLDVTADLLKNDLVAVSAGAGYTVLTTLGLENNLVSNVWGSAHTYKGQDDAAYANAVGGAKVNNANWMDEAWVAVTAGKSTLKLGRMELDTPLAFTETWSVEKNTFEAAVLINQDLPDTTLVAAYVGAGNGSENLGQENSSNVADAELAVGGVVNANGKFETFGTDGAYVFGLVNNSYKPLTVQAWYYDLQKLATAYWLQADLNMEGILAGAQYTSVKVGDGDSSGTYALQLGYEMKDVATFKVAYSATKDKGLLHGGNTATATIDNDGIFQGSSKLYTEAFWNYGYITQLDTESFKISIESPVNGMFDLGLYYTDADQTKKAGDNDMKEFAMTVGKDFGPLNATLAYINAKADDQNILTEDKGKAYNMVQAYLTLKF